MPEARPAAADPFAFDMGAFGGMGAQSSAELDSQAPGREPSATSKGADPTSAVPERQSAPAADPFAFDMSAFGGGFDGGQAEQSSVDDLVSPVPVVHSDGSDPYASSRGADAGAEQPKQSGPSADAFAFDMSAFGGGLGGAQAEAGSLEGQLPKDIDPQAEGSNPFASSRPAVDHGTAQQQPQGAPADPFAFDMGAFGNTMGAMASPQEAAAPAERHTKAPGAGSSSSLVHLSSASQSKGSIAGADPFAFSMSSFGNLSQACPESAEQDDNPENDPLTSDRGAAAAAPEEAPAAPDLLSGTLEPDAFGMGSMQGRTTGAAQMGPASGRSRPSDQHGVAAAVRRPGTPDPAEPSRPHGRHALACDSGEPSTSGREWQAAQAGSSNQAQEGRSDAHGSTQQHALAAFEPQPFEPLSTREAAHLERLLRSLAGLFIPGAQAACSEVPYPAFVLAILYAHDWLICRLHTIYLPGYYVGHEQVKRKVRGVERQA